MAGDSFAAVLLILVTLFVPPVGVFMIGGCCPDLFVNICLTLLGYLPGHIHAFYCEYVYYDRRSRGHVGRAMVRRAPGVMSNRIQNGGDMTNDYNYVPAQPAQGYQLTNRQRTSTIAPTAP